MNTPISIDTALEMATATEDEGHITEALFEDKKSSYDSSKQPSHMPCSRTDQPDASCVAAISAMLWARYA